MVKKKSVKKVKSLPVKKKVVKKAKVTKAKSKNLVLSSRKKIKLVLRNLVLFIGISFISFILYLVSNKDIFRTLFSLLAMIFGFVSVAFLIVLLIFFFMKLFKK
jgi:hypothetical protein